jgi:Protein of unknown function (DUF1420)
MKAKGLRMEVNARIIPLYFLFLIFLSFILLTSNRPMSLNELSANHSFLRLEDLLLSPPLPAIVSLLIVLGTLNLSTLAAHWLNAENKTPIELAAVFVITTSLLAALLHAIAWAGYASLPLLRWIAWVLAALGVLGVSKWKPRKAVGILREFWHEGSRVERFSLIVSVLTFVGLFAAALGPAVDADSLEQHLAVPLDWLRHGGAYPRPDWFTARYVGLGESLNMLGLAAGTDGLGAAFQAAGLIIALLAVTAFTKTRADQRFAVLLVAACPIIVPLVINQKPQLLPVAALTVALVIIIKRFNTFDLTTAVLAFGCAAFAMASKHSFLLTGSVVMFIGLVAAVRSQRPGLGLLVSAACFSILAVPVFARNFVFYGDPLSPLLEQWRPDGDPAVIAYAQGWLRDAAGPVTLEKLARLPWDLVVTPRLELLHEALGIGVFGFLLALRERGPIRQLLLAALAAFALVVALGQPTPRFFLEPYLWCAAAAAAVPWRPLKSLFLVALTAQAVLVAGVASYLAVVLFPGGLTQTGRERVMSLMAPGYAAAKWLDATLPLDAVVLDGFHSRALLPRPFVVGDRFLLTDEPNARQQLSELVKKKQVTVLVTHYPINDSRYEWLAARHGTPLAGPAKFREAARSPFNRGNSTSWIVTSLNVDGPGSQAK